VPTLKPQPSQISIMKVMNPKSIPLQNEYRSFTFVPKKMMINIDIDQINSLYQETVPILNAPSGRKIKTFSRADKNQSRYS
jgi:hypothetical protein